jgi:hypothetical protein
MVKGRPTEMEIELEVVNWGKYNARSDVKHATWLKLSNRIMEDSVIGSLTAAGFKFWIYLLTECSKEGQRSIRRTTENIRRISRLRTHEIHMSIRELTEKNKVLLLTPSNIEELNAKRVRIRALDKIRLDKNRLEEIAMASAEAIALPTKRVRENSKDPSNTTLVWEAYAEAYGSRYGEKPPRNSRNMGLCKNFVARMPAEDATEVARFYLTHNDTYYVKSLHPLSLMLRDAEKLRTEWKVGRQMTTQNARQIEQLSANADAVATFLKRNGEGA